MTKVYTPYSEHGALRDARVFMTPQVRLWYNNKKTKRDTKKKFSKNVFKIITDIQERGRPYSGHIKTIVKCEVPIFYMRLNNKGERIHFDWKQINGQTEIKLLAVSNKKNIQQQLEYSAEHKVHSSTLDLLEWESQNPMPELDLSNCTDEEIIEIYKNAKEKFGQLPPSEIDEGWNEELYKSRMERATIYDYRFPNVKTFDLDEELPEILKLHEEQEKILEEQKQYFLLEGVAGTGKTTILLYRFIGNVKAMMEQDKFQPEKFLFVTHNERLKIQILKSLRFFFDQNEMKLVSKSIMSVHEAISNLIGYSLYKSNFVETKRLTRLKFKKILAGNSIDTDLFWEEYRGILRGYNLHGEKRILEKDVYLDELGRRRGKIDYSQREKFYTIASDLEKNLSRDKGLDPNQGGWDDLDLVIALQQEIDKGKLKQKIDFLYDDEVKKFESAELNRFVQHLYPKGMITEILDEGIDFQNKEWENEYLWKTIERELNKNGVEKKLDFLYIDEVQDLTTAELDVFVQLLNPNGIQWFAAAGDVSQSVQPSAFTWQSLRDLITKIVGVHVTEEYRLDENFRSTPHLVSAANRILDISKTYSGQNKTHLQRPIKGENEGEPMFVFEKPESELLEMLNQNNLPNSDCLLLTRDEKTKKDLKNKVSEKQSSFIETIARYKGLEDRDVLLWDPCSGSDNILDLLHHPKRGEQTRGKISNITSGRLELNFLFVALTRARYLLGVFAPEDIDRQHFLHHAFRERDFCNFDSDDKIQVFGSTKMDREHYIKRAQNLVENGNLAAASGTYRQIDMMHEFHYFRAEGYSEEENYPQAVIEWGKAVEAGNKEDETAHYSAMAREKIADYSTLAIEFSTEEHRNDVKACIRIHAYDILPEKARNKFKGDDFYELGDFKEAARFYFEAGEPNLVNKCLSRFSQNDNIRKIELLVLVDRLDEAEIELKNHYKKEENKKTGIQLAMSSGREVDKFFSSEFELLKPRFIQIQPEWAKDLARSSSNSRKWLRTIDQIIHDQILSKPVDSEEIAEKQLQIFKQKKDETRMKGLKLIATKNKLSNAVLKRIDRELIRSFGNNGDIIKLIIDSEEEEIPEIIDDFVNFKEQIEKRPITLINVLKEHRISHLENLKNQESTTIQKLIALSLLAEYDVSIEAKDEAAIFELVEKLHSDHCRRTKQEIVQACSSLIGSHIVDIDHPITVKKIRHEHRLISTLFKMLFFDSKFDVDLFKRVVMNYTFHPKYKSSERMDKINFPFYNKVMRLHKQESCFELYWKCKYFEISTGRKSITPAFISNSISDSERLDVNEILHDRRKSLPQIKITKDDDSFIGPSIENTQKLTKASKQNSKWFTNLITMSKKYSILWSSVFIDDNEEKGSLDEFDFFTKEQEVITDKAIQVKNPKLEDYDQGLQNDDVLDLFDDEVNTLKVQEDNRPSLLADTFLTDEIIDKTNKGKSTLKLIKRDLKQLAGDNPIEANKFLHVAFNSVFEMDWPKAYQFAVLLSIWDIEGETEGFQILDLSQRQTFGKFKNIHQMDIIKTNLGFSARVLN